MTADQTPEDGTRWTKGLGPTEMRFNAGPAWPIINDTTGRWEALANEEVIADRIIADHDAAAKLATARAALEYGTQWQREILDAHGLEDWCAEVTTSGGLTQHERKRILVLPNDPALFLHEVAHALNPASTGANGHDVFWGDTFTKLVTEEIKRLRDNIGGTVQ